MIEQFTLPFFSPAGTRRVAADGEALRRRADIAYLPLGTREILNRNRNPRLPFAWTINPYRGCELGCTYCYARYTHGFFDLVGEKDFERRIFVKQGTSAALLRRLRLSRLQGQPIAIGTATDPYQPAERHFGVTREILSAFLVPEGLTLSITTKSPLILRDLELLRRLDERHALTVNLTITAVDPELARRLEPQAPDPRSRLRAVERLAEAGLAVAVFVKPLLPGLNDSEEELVPLFAAVREAGAFDVAATPLFLPRATRAHFEPWLAEEFPRLAGLYRRLYSRRDHLDRDAQEQLLETFYRLRLAHGFPRPRPGRG